MGKHKPMFDPSTDCGDYVVCIGCKDVHVTGKKMQQKKYYSHTTRPGSLKEITMEKMREKWGGSELLRRAVRGMLPKNRLRDDRMARLKCKSTLELEARQIANTACFDRLRRPSTSFQGKHLEIRA
jgi:large subunit ribosomal protein L13